MNIHIIAWIDVKLRNSIVLVQCSWLIKVLFLAGNLLNKSLAVQIILRLTSSLGLNIGGLFLNEHILISKTCTFNGVY